MSHHNAACSTLLVINNWKLWYITEALGRLHTDRAFLKIGYKINKSSDKNVVYPAYVGLVVAHTVVIVCYVAHQTFPTEGDEDERKDGRHQACYRTRYYL